MTSRYAALLRGINVGGNKKVDMAGLRALMEELGCADVKTLLNSGNVAFSASKKPSRADIEKKIRGRYGFDVDVVLRTGPQLRKVIATNPFEDLATNGSRYFVTFLDPPMPAGALDGFDAAAYEPELLHVTNTELYTWLPEGIGDSAMMKALGARKQPGTATTRNWNTVTKLAELTA